MDALTIKTVFRVSFSIDDTKDERALLLKFCDRVNELAGESRFEGIHISETDAGPAWNAYMIITHENRDTLAAFAAELPRAAKAARVALNDWEATDHED